MNIYTAKEMPAFLALMPKIREKRNEWKIIEISIIDTKSHDSQKIAKRVRLYFVDNEKEGHIFICNEKELIVLAHMGENKKPEEIEDDLKEYMPDHGCKVVAKEMSTNDIEIIKVKLGEIEKANPIITLQQERLNRRENVIMIAEDDMFMRSLAKKALGSFAKIVEVDNGDNILDTYKKENPNMIFLDIHMPGHNGLEALTSLLKYDKDAYIIMLSADSNRENVTYAGQNGAHGFITKPFTQEKLIETMRKCPTYRDRLK